MKPLLKYAMLAIPLLMVSSGLYLVAGTGWMLVIVGAAWWADILFGQWKAARK